MIEIVEFKGEHLKELLLEDSVKSLRPIFTDDVIFALEAYNKELISAKQDGVIVACGGVSRYWPNRAEAWVFYRDSIGKNFVPVFRLIKKWLDAVDVKRLEAAIDVNCNFAKRNVELLGFKLEAPLMKSYLPDGADAALYARVR